MKNWTRIIHDTEEKHAETPYLVDSESEAGQFPVRSLIPFKLVYNSLLLIRENFNLTNIEIDNGGIRLLE